MGLGPHRTSLLERLGRTVGPITLDALIRDRETRSQARLTARIKYSMKHKAKVTPLAPVVYAYTRDKIHRWKWIGEKSLTFEYQGMVTRLYDIHTGSLIKAAGFKLPKLPPKKERVDG